MAKATQTKTTTRITFGPSKSKSSSGDMMTCNVCGGTGVQKKPAKKKA